MKPSDRYFKGYERIEEPKKNGKGTVTRMVYVGDWYGFAGGKAQGRAVKIKCTILCAVSAFSWLYAQLNPAVAGRSTWMAALSVLILIPLLFEIVAFANFLPAGEKWEYRIYDYGYRRLFLFSGIFEGIVFIWLGMEIGFLILFPRIRSAELRYLAAILICALSQAAVLYILHKNRPVILEKGR